MDYAKATKTFTDPVPLLDHKEWDDGAKAAFSIFSGAMPGLTIDAKAFYALWVEHGETLYGVMTYVRRLCEVKKELVGVKRAVSSWCRLSV